MLLEKLHKIYLIVATDEHMGIGKDGKMPWNLKNEMKHFTETTTKVDDSTKQNVVIMGRGTWESIPENHRPLKDRINVILTMNPDYKAEGAKVMHSLDNALGSADSSIEKIFIIGGGYVFKEFINDERLDGIFLTRINGDFECDTFFPEIPEDFEDEVKLGGAEEDNISYEFLYYGRKE